MAEGKHVFISHAAEDAVFAGRLAVLLTKRGAEVVSDANLSAGSAWSQAFRRAIENASALVLLIPSETARNRNSLWFEVGAARALGKRIIAVLPPGRHVADYPSNLADLMVLDTDRRPLEDIADTLIQAAPDWQHVFAQAGE